MNVSKYSISEFTNGFLIIGKDREPVEVIRQPTYFQVKLLNLDHILEFSFFDYYPFSGSIFLGLMANWKPENIKESGDPMWHGVYEWALNQTAKALGKRVHAQWRRLLSQVDPTILSAHKSMFAATFSGGEFERIPQLYDHKIIVNDIVNYRAAAIAARNVMQLIERNQEIQSSIYDQLGGKSQPYTMSKTFSPFLRFFSSKVFNPNHNRMIEAMHDWQDLFSVTGKKYRSLSRTLMSLPGGVPHGLLCVLPYIHLTRPVTDRLELLLLLLFNQIVRPGHINANVIHQATRERIKRAMQILSAHKNLTLSPRRSSDVRDLAQYLVDYPDRHQGNVVGLLERSIDWHRNQNEEDFINQLGNLGLETQCSIPPIPLPDSPGVKFLGTVNDISQEALKMKNCVASYASKAVNGNCYLFHVTYRDKEATVEVSPYGIVQQAYGPRNFRNSAAKWGRRMLGKWGKDFTEYRSEISTNESIGNPDDDYIPF